MILRKLAIYGFKSFADKTELDFGAGMTAVIGPNGCGKSNVVDAIRWVFGEQRASMLRSANMQEVIFSGTQKRQPLNMAEVTLTIENSAGVLPVEYGEVAITRRIYRSGESEYRLNKVPCRLRDIQNIFLDTGVGSSAYTTIENRMIEKILSDKAEERRVLFEEAAGIGKYKQMRKESLSKLDKTRQDLLRISDKVTEAERQVRILARHVEKAKKYKNYFDALKTLEISFENRNYLKLTEALNSRKAALKEFEEKREVLRANIATLESRVESMRLDALETERELELASRNVGESSEKIAEIDRDISLSEERKKSTAQTIERLENDAAQLEAQIEEAAKFMAQIEQSVIGRETDLEKSKERVSAESEKLAQFDETLAAKKSESEQIGRDRIEVVNLLGEAKSRQGMANSALSSSLEKKDRNSKEIHNLEVRREEYRDSIEACKLQLDQAQMSGRNYIQSREMLLIRIEKEEAHYHALVEKEKHLEAQISATKSQLKFLTGLDAAFEGYGAGVKALLTAKLPGMRGIVADLISVTDSAMLPALEKIAASAVQTVVFDTNANLENAIEFLRADKLGAARMVSLEKLSALNSNVANFAQNENLKSVTSFIKASEGCEIIVNNIFGNYAVAEDYKTALNAAQNISANCAVISRDGVICRGDGSVVAGTSVEESAGILARKQQIENLTQDIGTFESELVSVVALKDTCTMNRDEAKSALVEVDEMINKGERVKQEQETTIRHNELEMQNITLRIQTLTAEQSEMDLQIAEAQERIAGIEAEVATLANRRDELDDKARVSSEELYAMETERGTLAEHLKNIELEMYGLTNRIASDRRDIERLKGDIEQYGARKLSKIEDKNSCIADMGALEDSCKNLIAALDEAKAKRDELETAKNVVRENYAGKLAAIDELRSQIKLAQTEFEEVSNGIHDVELKISKDEQTRRHSREKIWEAYELDLESLPQEELSQISDNDDEVMQEISTYKERIKHVGQVNMAALEDYEIENARFIELSAQRDDLQSAVDELEKAISKLDKEARAQFLATFKEVEKNFTEMFTTLFEGGEASISLAEGVDPLEAEIHVNVRPAGKKMRGVQLLSGGERALTAISLLFALYLVKPSAYCILDELDAPLDDANITRFVKVLKKFAEKTQFIIITHNKRTMEAADLLYGVTQQESGVSTIVSVKFEDAELRAA